jgi:hypothetical protein
MELDLSLGQALLKNWQKNIKVVKLKDYDDYEIE